MANKKHSFVDEFLDIYFDFLKEYDNLDYTYTEFV